MATLENVLLPDIGDFAEVEVIEILVAPGERIEPEQSLLTLESDKATMDVPAPLRGTVREVKVAVGDKVREGSLLLTVETDPAGADEGAGGTTSASPDAAAVRALAMPAPAAPPAPAQAEAPAPDVATGPPPSAPAAPGPGPADTPVEVRLPDLGDFKDVPVIEILVAVGEQVSAEQSILILESDKATMDIPATAAGTVASIAVQVGDKLNQGDLLLTLTADAAAGGTPTAATPTAAAEEAAAVQAPARAPGEAAPRKAPILPRPEDMQAIARGRTPHASPAVRRFARELGVELALVKGSGRKGRVLKEDVQAYVKQALRAGAPAPAAATPFALPTAPAVDFARFGSVSTEPLARIRRVSGAHLHRCWLTVPHVTQFDQADITDLEAFRHGQKAAADKAGVKLTLMPFLLKAVAAALTQMPLLKASLAADGEHLIMKQYTHIGVAVDTPNGLVVPVVRDVDQKGVFALAHELAALGDKARAGKLLPGDMQGGVFSISSLGGIGGTAFTPIVNAPEVAILGVSRAETKPVWDGQTFQPRMLLPLSLSYDHRVVDGADGVRFTTLLAGLLGDLRRLVL